MISQSIGSLTPGASYAVTFSAAQRGNSCGNGGEDFQVVVTDDLLGSVVVGTFKPNGTQYQDYTTVVFTLQKGTMMGLRFVGKNSPGGDNMAFIDNVQVTVIDNSSGW